MQYVVGYLADGDNGMSQESVGSRGILTDWNGHVIGTYRITARWSTPRSFVSSHMHQVEAMVNGVKYTGRSAGVGMCYRGRKVAK